MRMRVRKRFPQLTRSYRQALPSKNWFAIPVCYRRLNSISSSSLPQGLGSAPLRCIALTARRTNSVQPADSTLSHSYRRASGSADASGGYGDNWLTGNPKDKRNNGLRSKVAVFDFGPISVRIFLKASKLMMKKNKSRVVAKSKTKIAFEFLRQLGAFVGELLDILFGPPKPLKLNFPHILLGTFLGENVPKVPCYLTFEDLNTHLHGKGLTRTGKSKLIEQICRDLLREGQGFTLIDPNGELFWEISRYLAQEGIPAYHLNPSDTKRLVGFNPFVSASKDEAALYTKADRMKKATLMTWGVEDDTQTPRLARLLRALYYTFLEQDLSIVALEYFLNPAREKQRQEIVNRIQNERFRSEWIEFYESSKGAIKTYLESTGNRIEIFRHPQMQRVMGLSENSINVKQIIDEGAVLLVNLQPSDIFGIDQCRVLGTLLINEIWEITRRRQQPESHFLIVDECGEYLTPDIPLMLSQAAKYGLHLMLFHQYDEQLPKSMRGAFQNARIKCFFTGQRKFQFSSPGLMVRIETENGFRYEDLDFPVYVKTPYVKPPEIDDIAFRKYCSASQSSFMTVSEIDRRLHMFSVRQIDGEGTVTAETDDFNFFE